MSAAAITTLGTASFGGMWVVGVGFVEALQRVESLQHALELASADLDVGEEAVELELILDDGGLSGGALLGGLVEDEWADGGAWDIDLLRCLAGGLEGLDVGLDRVLTLLVLR